VSEPGGDATDRLEALRAQEVLGEPRALDREPGPRGDRAREGELGPRIRQTVRGRSDEGDAEQLVLAAQRGDQLHACGAQVIRPGTLGAALEREVDRECRSTARAGRVFRRERRRRQGRTEARGEPAGIGRRKNNPGPQPAKLSRAEQPSHRTGSASRRARGGARRGAARQRQDPAPKAQSASRRASHSSGTQQPSGGGLASSCGARR
jgi:hypothetical protein